MGSVRIRVSSRTAGGLADHLPSEVLKQWLDESKKAIGDRAAEQLRAFSMDKTGRATGRYQAGIRETVLGNGDVRVDDPVVYGPWLEGVSQRNNSTRFKGYHLWRKTRDSVNRQAVGIAEEKLAPYIEELGGQLMAFNEAAIDSLFNSVVSAATTLGYFETVNTHEPKNAPGSGLRCSIWIDTMKPVKTSGLNVTSGLVTFYVRIYNSMLAEPQDDIDPQIMKAVSALIGSYTGDFDFGGVADVRMIDLLGAYSDGLSATAGYLQIDNKIYRVMVLNLPIVINDMWTQEG